jgi:hypothetical protein
MGPNSKEKLQSIWDEIICLASKSLTVESFRFSIKARELSLVTQGCGSLLPSPKFSVSRRRVNNEIQFLPATTTLSSNTNFYSHLANLITKAPQSFHKT